MRADWDEAGEGEGTWVGLPSTLAPIRVRLCGGWSHRRLVSPISKRVLIRGRASQGGAGGQPAGLTPDWDGKDGSGTGMAREKLSLTVKNDEELARREMGRKRISGRGNNF